MRAFKFKGSIPDDRRLAVDVPEEVPAGPAEVIILAPDVEAKRSPSLILNHAEAGVTRVYDRHSYDAERRDALQRWAVRLEEILAGKPAKVTPIRAATAPERQLAAR